MVQSKVSPHAPPTDTSAASRKLSFEKFKDPIKTFLHYFSIPIGFAIAFASGMHAANSPPFNFNPDPQNLCGRISIPRLIDAVSSFGNYLRVEKGIDSSAVLLFLPSSLSFGKYFLSLSNFCATGLSSVFSCFSSFCAELRFSSVDITI